MWLGVEEVQCFQAVMIEGSMTAASAKLNKAKSAVSYSVNKLEDQLGFMLFKRGSYRLEATRRGREFFDRSHRLLEEAQRLESFAEQMKSGQELQLSLSASELYPLNSVSQLLKKLADKFPATELRFQREIMSGAELLATGKVDLAIFETQKRVEEFEYRDISSVDLRLSISTKHPFLSLKKEAQSIEVLSEFPQIIQRSTIASPESAGVYRDSIKWYVTDINTKKSLIAEGLGWGRLPLHETDSLVEAGVLTTLDHLEDTERVEIVLARRKKMNHGVVSEFIWENI